MESLPGSSNLLLELKEESGIVFYQRKWENLSKREKLILETDFNIKPLHWNNFFEGDISKVNLFTKPFSNLPNNQKIAILNLKLSEVEWNEQFNAYKDLRKQQYILQAFTSINNESLSQNRQITIEDVEERLITASNIGLLTGIKWNIQTQSQKRSLLFIASKYRHRFTESARIRLLSESTTSKNVLEQVYSRWSVLGWSTTITPEKKDKNNLITIINDSSGQEACYVKKIIVVKCIKDVQDAVLLAERMNSPISIAGSRHSQGGHTTYPDSLHIDISQLKKMKVEVMRGEEFHSYYPNSELKSSSEIDQLSSIEEKINLNISENQNIYQENELYYCIHTEVGATWQDIIDHISPKGLSIIQSQTSAVFTVGGSIGVNCHGRSPNIGPLSSTILWIKLVDASGNLVECSRVENKELFSCVMGGYGGFGVVVEAKIRLTYNYFCELEIFPVLVPNFISELKKYMENSNVQMIWARFDPLLHSLDGLLHVVTSINNNKDENNNNNNNDNNIINNIFIKESKDEDIEIENKLKLYEDNIREEIINSKEEHKAGLEQTQNGTVQFLAKCLISSSKRSEHILMARWYLERKARAGSCRSQRNNFLATSVDALRPFFYKEGKEVDILLEFYVPFRSFEEWLSEFVKIQQVHNVRTINITVRYVDRDRDAILSYAHRDEMLSLVLYYNTGLSEGAVQNLHHFTEEMVSYTTSVGGSFYLCYRPHYTRDQLVAAYPMWDEFVRLKHKYDPSRRFWNQFWDRYADPKEN